MAQAELWGELALQMQSGMSPWGWGLMPAPTCPGPWVKGAQCLALSELPYSWSSHKP